MSEKTNKAQGKTNEVKRDGDNSSTGGQTKKPFKGRGYAPNKFFDNPDNYPKHLTNMVHLIRNNSEIRRFTALGILNILLQRGEIKGNKRYVKFLWNKFQVICDGLGREYFYTEVFFIKSLIAAVVSFAASAENIINEFSLIELNKSMDSVVSDDEVKSIVHELLTRDENNAVENNDVEDNTDEKYGYEGNDEVPPVEEA